MVAQRRPLDAQEDTNLPTTSLQLCEGDTMTTCLDCDRPPLWRCYCKYHYNRWRMRVRDADPTVPRCANNCGRASFVRGLCKSCSDGADYRAKHAEARAFARVDRVPVKVVRYCACGGRYYAKGKCKSCYRRDKYASKREAKPVKPDCACGNPHYAKGACMSCYNNQWQREHRKSRAKPQPVKVAPIPCACGQRVKRDGKCGTCLRKLSFRCADTNWRHEWVVREKIVYCRRPECRYVKGPL